MSAKNKAAKLARIILAAVLVISLVPASAFADQLYNNGQLTTYFQRDTGTSTGWVDYIQKDYRIGEGRDIVYCLEGGKQFSATNQNTWVEKDNVISALRSSSIPFRSGMNAEKYYEGLKYILFFGYPNFIPDDLTAEQAHYATSAAIHWYSAWAAGQNYSDSSKFGYSFFGECYPTANYSTGGRARMRAKSGVAGSALVYSYATSLFESAAAGKKITSFQSAELYRTDESQPLAEGGAVMAAEDGDSYVSYVTFHTRGAQLRPYDYEVSGVTGATVEEILPIRTENNRTDSSGHPQGAHVWVDLKITIPRSAENSGKTATLTAKARSAVSDSSIAVSKPASSSNQTTVSALITSGTRYEQIEARVDIRTPEILKTVTVTKASEIADISPGSNRTYTFDGCTFGIYRTEQDAENGNDPAEILTLQPGALSAVSGALPAGDYWVRELTAPDCYYLNDEVYKAEGAAEEDCSVTIKNVPKTDPAAVLVIGKVDASGADRPITWSPAVFRVEYFDSYACEGSPLRTWYFRTGADGRMSMGDEELFLDDAEHDSSELYRDSFGFITIPTGAVRVSEVSAPSGYAVSGNSAEGIIRINSEGMAEFSWEEGVQGVFANEIEGGVGEAAEGLIIGNSAEYKKIRVRKNEGQRNGNTSMEGIKISVTNASGHTVYVKSGEKAAEAFEDGALICEITLDESGTGETDRILPFGRYELKEESIPPESGFLINSTWRETAVIDASYSEEAFYELSNEPKLFGVRGVKIDSDRNAPMPSGDGTLMGAEISVINRSEDPVYLGGQAYAPGETVLKLTTTADGSYGTAGAVLPYGSYELRETKAPAGYALNSSWSYRFSASGSDANRKIFEVPEESALKDEPLKQVIRVIKWDKQRGTGVPGEVSPKSALEGISFEVVNRSGYPIVYKEETFESGEAVAVITTAYDPVTRTYMAQTEDLPYGRYDVKELYEGSAEDLKANRWYLVDSSEVVSAVLHGEGAAILDFADTRINSITVTKTVSGNMGNKEKDFEFELILGDNGGIPVRFEKTAHDGTVTKGTAVFSGGRYAFTLRHGESVTFSYITGGNSYTVNELDAGSEGYETSYEGERSGTLDLDTVVNVKNSRQSVIPTGLYAPCGIAGAGAAAAAAGAALLIKRKKAEDA